MTNYKPGDRVRVEFEATITNWGDRWLELDNGESVYRENVTITRINPPVPTEFGSVVELGDGFRLVFDGCIWSGHGPFYAGIEERYMDSTELAKLNFTVIREGI